MNPVATKLMKDPVTFKSKILKNLRFRFLWNFTSIMNEIMSIDSIEQYTFDSHLYLMLIIMIVQNSHLKILQAYWYIDKLFYNVLIMLLTNNIQNHYLINLVLLNLLDLIKLNINKTMKKQEISPASIIKSKPPNVRSSFRKDSFELLREILTNASRIISHV